MFKVVLFTRRGRKLSSDYHSDYHRACFVANSLSRSGNNSAVVDIEGQYWFVF